MNMDESDAKFTVDEDGNLVRIDGEAADFEDNLTF